MTLIELRPYLSLGLLVILLLFFQKQLVEGIAMSGLK